VTRRNVNNSQLFLRPPAILRQDGAGRLVTTLKQMEGGLKGLEDLRRNMVVDVLHELLCLWVFVL